MDLLEGFIQLEFSWQAFYQIQFSRLKVKSKEKLFSEA